MNACIAIIFLVSVTPSLLQDWTISNSFQDFIEDQSSNMKSFFDEEKSLLDSFVSSSYEDAVKMKESVDSYLEAQQNKIADNVNNYVDTIKESGRKLVDTWSHAPSDESEAQLLNPDMVLTVPAIVTRNGYPCETHTVVSKGYVLNIHRIPRSKTASTTPSKTILFQHGLFASSADWIINGPEKGLAYVLADAGYDVWISNIRGNKYSREHIKFNIDSKIYWNFSWHDIALYDIPAVIDHILNTKGNGTRIAYIGHSMGSTILFAMLSLRPEYNQILTAGFALAPVVFLSDLKSPIKSLAPIASNVAHMEMLYGSHEFVPKNSALGRISSSCSGDSMDIAICKNIAFYICGFNDKQFNKTLLPVFLAHLGTGTSWKTAVHFAQEVVSGGRFQQFDYGSYYNKKMYGSDIPPEYDLSKVTLPIKLFWSQNDLLSSEKDVKMLYERLPATTEIFMVPDPNFNHLDYLWAVEAPRLLNYEVLSSLNKIFKDKEKGYIRFGK